jgi:hypothetical protein
VTETRPPYNVEKSPFAGLFKKHPWLVPLLMMLRRQMGIFNEFIEVNVKPFTKK